MKVSNKAIYISFGVMAAMALYSCVSDEPDRVRPTGNDGVFLEASIEPMNDPYGQETRAEIATGNDQWSYVRFNSSTDTIGFFSTKGNVASGENEPFINAPMVWTGNSGSGTEPSRYRGSFKAVDMDYDIGLIQQEGVQTFVYFPYDKNVLDPGMLLRKRLEDGSTRCIDALEIRDNFVNNDQPILSGTFQHAFAEIMFVRGEGFDNPPEGQERITVVMTQGFSHVKVGPYDFTNHNYWRVFVPVYDASCGMTEEECRRWDAWKGDVYLPNEFVQKEQNAYYCILPTGTSSLNTTVDYIEACDNNGEWHIITSFYLRGEGNKSINPTHRYRMNIVMEGLEAKVYPWRIEPWEDTENITDERNSGINNPQDLLDFITAYNRYNNQTNPDGSRGDESTEKALEQFGNKYTTDGKVGWHFYLNQSFTLQEEGFNLRIENLRDTLDGMRNTLSGLKINNDSGFINEVSEGGCLMNLNITGLTVNNTSQTGGVANIISGGTIQYCNIDGNITVPGQPVGMLAASMTGGTIRGCTFTGILAGARTYNKLFATDPTGGTWEGNNNNYGGIIFTEY